MSYYTKKQIIDGHLSQPENFTARDVLLAAGFNNNRAACHWLGLSRRTLERYIERNRLPGPVCLACRYRAGDLSEVCGGHFDGWHIKNDCLFDNYGHTVTRADLMKHGQTLYRLYCLEQENAILKAKLNPTPPASETDHPDPGNVVPLYPIK